MTLLNCLLPEADVNVCCSAQKTAHQHVDKAQVARGFDKAAARYTSLALVQQEIAVYGLTKLNKYISGHSKVDFLLDIGCGTASSFKAQKQVAKQVIGLDISLNMLRTAQQENKAVQGSNASLYLSNGDAESLPIQSNSVDVVYSSMALQWCESPERVLNEVYRVLKPGAKALLAILTGESFDDLQQAWQYFALPSRVNTFHSAQTWLKAAKQLPISTITTHKQFISQHDSVVDMLSSIKQIGANTRVSSNAQVSGYISKQELQQLTQFIREKHNASTRLPLCYDLLFLEIGV